MKQELKDTIARVQDAIFQRPDIALGFGVWHRSRNAMITNQRPDGSVTQRRDKTVLSYMKNGSLFLAYNGGSFESRDIWTYLRDRYGEQDFVRLLHLVCDDYRIPFDEPTRTMSNHYSRKPSPRPATTPKAKTIPAVGDESDVSIIPEHLVKKTINLRREDPLRSWLETWIDDMVLECAWHDYGVGIAKKGQPIFWYYDRDGRVRDGKIMKYRIDGHRDRKADGSILAAGALLKNSGRLPADWKRCGCLYGEHLLQRFPDATVGLVESEKTAIVAATFFTRSIWLATGGSDQNLDRAAAVLNGRRVIAFPDADATKKWTERFQGLPGWSISTIAKDYADLHGPEWDKCDLCDVLAQQHTQKEEVL